MSVAMVSMATTPAAAALIRQRSRASRNGPWKRRPVRFRDAPSEAARSSAPHIMPHSRGLMFSKSSSLRTALAVSVATVTILVEPCSIPAAASKASRYSDRRLTSAAPAHFGSTIPSGRPGMTAARSPSVMSVSSALTRTYVFWFAFRASSIARTERRAPTFSSGAMESSRSRISASAAVFLAFSNLRWLSPGTNRNDRIGLDLRFAMHQAGPAAACHHLAALIGHGVLELDDTLVRPRLALALGDDLGVRLERIAVKYRFWKLDVGHAEVADRGAERRIVDAHADHDAERIEAVEQPLAEFGIFGEMRIYMQRLRVHGQQAEHRVVHLGHGPGEFMMKLPADLELLEIQSRHQRPL